MPKVIRKGKEPKPVVFRGECKKCGCVAEYKEAEGQLVADGSPTPKMITKCPECGEGLVAQPKK